MGLQTAGVVGLGTMGAGIVELFARGGLDVIAVEVSDELLATGRRRLEQSLGRAVERGRLSEADRDAQLGRVRFTVDREQLAAADVVIEAVPERLDIKTELFGELDRICPATTILATNTSSLPVTRIAAATGRPDRVIGMHFFNPAPVMRLVEVVHTVLTADDVVSEIRELAGRCGKSPVVVTDRAGFVANALLFGCLNDAAGAAETGQAAIADIDAAVVAACGLPMGPFTLLDLIGLDVSLDVLETMYEETRDRRYAPAPLLRRLVMAGQLGRKTGRGYYRYDVKPPEPTIAAPAFARAAPAPDAGRVVAVVGDRESDLLAALGGPAVVAPADVTDADVVVVDGGSADESARLCREAAAAAKPGAVLAVASLGDAALAAVAADACRPADVVALHRPLAPRRQVVEVVTTSRSAPRAVAAAVAVVRAAGLVALPCRDRPGRLLEAIVLPHLADAVRMVDDSYAAITDVEAAMTLGCGYPDGPFAMVEAVGADRLRAALLALSRAVPTVAPPAPLLDELAAFGQPQPETAQ